MLRMKLSDLTYEILEEIVKIYDKTVGGHGSQYLHPGDLDDVRRQSSVERRFGSKVTGHSKLWIQRDWSYDEPAIYFRFDPNTITGENEKLGEELKKKFEQAVDDFLRKQGLAI